MQNSQGWQAARVAACVERGSAALADKGALSARTYKPRIDDALLHGGDEALDGLRRLGESPR